MSAEPPQVPELSSETLRTKLEAEMGPCLSSDLRAHLERGVVLVVAERLSLLDVAVAIAADDAGQVKTWVEAGELRNPTLEEAAAWRQEGELPFQSVIVRPYVLAQRLAAQSTSD